MTKTLAFHASTNYQIRAPRPFSSDVHEDILADLVRINGQRYNSELDFHVDLSQSLKRLNDGHCTYVNRCFDCKVCSNLVERVELTASRCQLYTALTFLYPSYFLQTSVVYNAFTLLRRPSKSHQLNSLTKLTSGKTLCLATSRVNSAL